MYISYLIFIHSLIDPSQNQPWEHKGISLPNLHRAQRTQYDVPGDESPETTRSKQSEQLEIVVVGFVSTKTSTSQHRWAGSRDESWRSNHIVELEGGPQSMSEDLHVSLEPTNRRDGCRTVAANHLLPLGGRWSELAWSAHLHHRDLLELGWLYQQGTQGAEGNSYEEAILVEIVATHHGHHRKL